MHVQAVAALLPAGELEFAGHVTHVAALVAPTAAENLPAVQPVQLSVPYCPAVQLTAHVSTGPE